MIVADANVVAALVLPHEDSSLAERLLCADGSWVAPPLILAELRSVVATLVRNGRQSAAQGASLFALAVEALEAVTFEPNVRRVMELVAASGCSSYDCEYVAVAEEIGCRLVTLDQAVLRAFPGMAARPEAIAGVH